MEDLELGSAMYNVFTVNESNGTEPDGSIKFSKIGNLDLSTGDLAEYVNQLKTVNVSSVELSLDSYDGTIFGELSGELDFGGGHKLTLPTKDLSTMRNHNTILKFEDIDVLAFLSTSLLNHNIIDYDFNGSISNAPANAEIRVTFHLDIVASQP